MRSHVLSATKIAYSFAPGLLIAGPDLGDPNFDRTVVLMTEHGEQGAMGFVLNRVSEVSMEEIAAGLEVELGDDAAGALVVNGGPVQEGMLWVLFKHAADDDAAYEEDEDGVVSLTDTLALGHGREVLEAFVSGLRSEPFVLVLGYAGWGETQLEEETKAGAWIPIDLDLDILFKVPVAARWEEALQRAGLRPGAFVMGRQQGLA
jgi:putative transcriptional regulator